jgi:hypothetical protein
MTGINTLFTVNGSGGAAVGNPNITRQGLKAGANTGVQPVPPQEPPRNSPPVNSPPVSTMRSYAETEAAEIRAAQMRRIMELAGQTSATTRRTETTDPRSSKYIPPQDRDKPKNILHNFRSFTYNFTLAALPPNQVNFTFTSVDQLTNIVLTSKGKGTPTDPARSVPTSSNDTPVFTSEKVRALQTVEANMRANLKKSGASDEEINKQLAPIVAERTKFQGQAAVQATTVTGYDPSKLNAARFAYNKSSAGKFDMYIDDIEIISVIGHNSATATSNGYEFTFTVVEPYSMFGFIDALLKTALDTGYTSYIDCVYVLAIDFLGYLDRPEFPEPVDIPRSKRFFPIRFWQVNTNVSERGTIYTCKAVLASDMSFSIVKGKIKSDIVADGPTIKDQLTQLMQNLTTLSQDEAKRQGSIVYDKYAVQFPLTNGQGENARLANSKVEDKSTFRSDESIQKAIDDIITKSQYGIDAVKPKSKGVTSDGMVYTWKISSKVEFDESNERDPNTLARGTKITYIVTEYKTSAEQIVPGQAAAPINYEALADLSLRKYDYMFTGKNTDVLDFKVDFNLAFFSGVTGGFAVTDSPDRQGTGKDNSSQPATTPSAQTPPSSNNAATPSHSTAGSAQTRTNSRNQPDPWRQLAYQMYNNMINSSVALYQGEFTILGDPYFLIGGDGNTNGVAQGKVADNGAASAISGDVLVILNFYNPIDLNYDTGLMDLSNVPVPFSGIFKIYQVVSSFKAGVFKQVLHFIRMNANPDITAEYRSAITEVTNPSKAKLQDAAPPTVTPKTNTTGVVNSELENTTPTPASVVSPKYAGFVPATPGAPANPITAANMSLAEIKNLSANLQATLANPLAGLQAQVASAQASLQGAVAGVAAQVTGAITNPINELKSNINSVQVSANATVNQIKSPLSSIMRT